MADKLPQVTFDPVESGIASVSALFDPATLVIVKSALWTPQPTSYADTPSLQFSHAQGRRLSLQLQLDATTKKPSVQPDLDALVRLAMVIDGSGSEDLKRPPLINVVWAKAGTLPAFKGVIDRIEIQYQQLLADGTPQQARVLVAMEEAAHLSVHH